MNGSSTHRLRAIIFDLDDTLYPEREYVASGMHAVAQWAQQQFGNPEHETFEQLWQLFQEGVRGDTFNRWLAGQGLEPQDWVSVMVKVYRTHMPCIAPFAGAEGLLDRLRTSYRLGVITDGHLDSQQRKIAAMGLERQFAAIVYTATLGETHRKPSTRPFELVLEYLGISACEAAYVGDNPRKDFRGARQLGMATVRIRHHAGLYSRLEPASSIDAADIEIPVLDVLEAALADRESDQPADIDPLY